MPTPTGATAAATPSATTSALPATSPSSAPAPSTPAPREISGVDLAGRVTGFSHPWELRFLPEGAALVTERPGTLSAIVDDRRQVVAEVPGVVAQGEGGLMGLALDPGFASNRRIYLCHAFGASGSVRDVRVVRYRLAEDLRGISDPTPVVTGIPAGAGNRHLGCRLEVGPDGMLWVTTGDAVQPTAPQDPRSLAGKVLRVTLDGDPAPGNPGDGWDPRVLSIGHRNAQALVFRPDDDAAVEVEHGTGCDDEVNVLAPGGNYGWDPRGPGGRYAEQAPMTSPDIPGARTAAWSSGCPTIAPSGASFLTDPGWGQWQGWLAVAVLKDQELVLMDLPGDQVRSTQTLLRGELGRLRMAREAPDGSLWLLQDADDASVVRVVPRP
ncbi:MAG TPA: PQQ-dependent sugar dehydrogenase [Candidatus Nanopelagicales bacterium]